MSEEYTALVDALKGTGIPFAEYGWDRSPETDYGVVTPEFEPDFLNGDDRKVERALEGSVDLFFRRLANRESLVRLIENVLDEYCGASWHLNSSQHEEKTGIFHIEWTFQLEA